MTDLGTTYHAARARIGELVSSLDDEVRATTVPACPDWSVHDVVAHVAGMAHALTNGDIPTGDFDPWIQKVLGQHRELPLDELLARWDAAAPGLDTIMELAGPQLAPDVVTHEHDIRGAIGQPANRDHPDLQTVLPIAAALPAAILQHRDLGALELVTPEGTHRSHDADAGWTIRCSGWEAFRIMESRRTADELRALDSDGDPEPFIEALDRRQPLPLTSLGE